ADMIWCTDAAGDILFVSPAWEEITGQTIEQTRKFGWLEIVHPDDRARPVEVWKAAAAEKRPYESELRVRTRDGRYRHFQPSGVPLFGEDGAIREWIGTTTDFTDRKEAENALQEGQRRYQLATAAGGVGVWELDLESGDMYIDPQLKAMLGFQDDEIRNHLDDVIRRVHPGDVERAKAELDARRDSLIGQSELELRLVHKDGSTRWFLARG